MMARIGYAGDDVVIRLSHDQALVLFELLHHWESQHGVTQPEHHADQVALWNSSCLLESWKESWSSCSSQPTIA